MSEDPGEYSVLSKDESALVWSKEEGFTLRLPDYSDDELVPPDVVVLSALFRLVNSGDQEQIDVLKDIVFDFLDTNGKI